MVDGFRPLPCRQRTDPTIWLHCDWPVFLGHLTETLAFRQAGIVRRLLVGDSVGAGIALARLRSAGIRPPLQAGVTDVLTARRGPRAVFLSAWHRPLRPTLLTLR